MGPCNLKWTAKEEASLKDGILKHGPGKWADILKDPQFRSVLRVRSNVDLKDKWRNMQLAMNGESRNSCKTVQKNIKMTSRRCDKSVALISEGCDEDKIAEPEPPSSFNKASQEGGSEKITRFDDRKLEDQSNVKKPSTSTQIQQGMEYDSAYSNSRWAEVDAELMMIAQMMLENGMFKTYI